MNNPIHQSFEIAAARCEDLTPLVYRRLFRHYPEAEGMFRRDGSDVVKGSMLAFTIDAILDYAGERRFRMIECEVLSHDAYGTPPLLFNAVVRILAETLRAVLGADWWAEIDDAWRKLLERIGGMGGAQPHRSATRRAVPRGRGHVNRVSGYS